MSESFDVVLPKNIGYKRNVDQSGKASYMFLNSFCNQRTSSVIEKVFIPKIYYYQGRYYPSKWQTVDWKASPNDEKKLRTFTPNGKNTEL